MTKPSARWLRVLEEEGFLWRRYGVIFAVFFGGMGFFSAVALYMSPAFSWAIATEYNSLIAIILSVFVWALPLAAFLAMRGNAHRGLRKTLLAAWSFFFGLSLGLLTPAVLTEPAWESSAIAAGAPAEDETAVAPTDKTEITFIAHGGGALGLATVTNSLEALEANRDYFEWFEIDLVFTRDGELVCLHDWGPAVSAYGFDYDGAQYLDEFLEKRQNLPWTACTLNELLSWLEKNPSKRIVTDVKDDNLQALRVIAERAPELLDQFVVQIYYPEEYPRAREFGFTSVIWTTYRLGNEVDDYLQSNLPGMEILAVASPAFRASDNIALTRIQGVPHFAHTVNNLSELTSLASVGVTGFYTDFVRQGPIS